MFSSIGTSVTMTSSGCPAAGDGEGLGDWARMPVIGAARIRRPPKSVFGRIIFAIIIERGPQVR
jgi:hypothetical protein